MISKTILERQIECLEDVIAEMKKNANNIESIEVNDSRPMRHKYVGAVEYIGEREFSFKVKFLFSRSSSI